MVRAGFNTWMHGQPTQPRDGWLTRSVARSAALLLTLVLIGLAGCAPNPAAPAGKVMVATDPTRDLAAAKRHTDEGINLLEKGNLAAAHKELKAAIAAEPLYGPAHNGLGAVYYQQKNYYLAASEFQLAATAMPHKGEPRNNLGLVYEDVGRLDDAARSYDEALALSPGSVEITANLARALVRLGRDNDRTRQLLRDVVMKDTRPQWVSWARERLIILGAPKTAATSQAAQ